MIYSVLYLCYDFIVCASKEVIILAKNWWTFQQRYWQFKKLQKLIGQNIFWVYKLKNHPGAKSFEKYLKTNCVCHNITRQISQDKLRTIIGCGFREIYKCCAILKSFAKNWHFRKLILILIHTDNIHKKSQRISLVF